SFLFTQRPKKRSKRTSLYLEQIFYAVVIGRLIIAKILLCYFRYAHTKIFAVIRNGFNSFSKIVSITTNQQIPAKANFYNSSYNFFSIYIAMGNKLYGRVFRVQFLKFCQYIPVVKIEVYDTDFG